MITHYFLGLDPAPSQGQKSDQGAAIVLRARAAVPQPGPNESDWNLDFVWARILRGADASQWSGMIHGKHQDFGFSLIVLDLGGGGQWIMPELRKPRQLVDGVSVEVKPIVSRSSPSIEGDLILVMVSRGDEGMKQLFPELKHAHGDDVLRDGLNTIFQTALVKGTIGIPEEHSMRSREEMQGWPEEKVWASKLLTAFGVQATRVTAETNEDGTWRLTRNNARIFSSTGKDDLVDAARNAYAGFRIWLLSADADVMAPEDAGLCDSV